MDNCLQEKEVRGADAAYEAQLDALMWYIEHPEALEAMRDETLKAFIRYMKRRVEEDEAATMVNR